jgi:hypothetical protein
MKVVEFVHKDDAAQKNALSKPFKKERWKTQNRS